MGTFMPTIKAHPQFHIKCVNLTAPLPETWYCPDCVKSLGLTSSDGKRERKGRKK